MLLKRHSDRASIILGNLNEHTHKFTLDIHTLLTLRGQVLHLYCVENTKTFTWIAQFNINSKTYCTSGFVFIRSTERAVHFERDLAHFWPWSGLESDSGQIPICSKVNGSLGHHHPIAPCLVVVILTTSVNYSVANMWNHVNTDRKINQCGHCTQVFQGNTWCGSDESKKTAPMGTRSRICLSVYRPCNLRTDAKAPRVRPSSPDASKERRPPPPSIHHLQSTQQDKKSLRKTCSWWDGGWLLRGCSSFRGPQNSLLKEIPDGLMHMKRKHAVSLSVICSKVFW